jgi:hypothetical protein
MPVAADELGTGVPRQPSPVLAEATDPDMQFDGPSVGRQIEHLASVQAVHEA